MGSLGFDDLKEQVQFRLGRLSQASTDGLTSSGANNLNMYGIWVNNAYKQICSSEYLMGITKKMIIPDLEYSTTETTTAGAAYIDIPTDSLLIRKVMDSTNGSKLSWIPFRKYIAYTDRADSGSRGTPTEWAHMTRKIFLHPTPDAVITEEIFYKKLPGDLTGSNTTIIGSEWDEPITLLAAIKGMTALGDYVNLKPLKEEFIEIATGIIHSYYMEGFDRNESFRPDPAYMPIGR
jgi:hypothetical protein